MKFIILFTAIILTSVSSFAQISYETRQAQCELQNFDKTYLDFLGEWPLSEAVKTEPHITCNDAKNVDQLIQSLKKEFPEFKANKTSLFLIHSGSSPFADFALHLPLNFNQGTLKDPTIVHEYGHLIFLWNSTSDKNVPSLKKLNNKNRQIEQLRKAYYTELQNNNTDNGNDKDAKELERYVKKLLKQITKF